MAGLNGWSSPARWGPAPFDLERGLRDRLAALKLPAAIDFEGVMTDNRVHVDETGHESVVWSRFKGRELDRLRRLGVATYTIPTERNSVFAVRAGKFKLKVEQGVLDMVAMLNDFCCREVSRKISAVVGNDVNHIADLPGADTAIVIAGVHPAVVPYTQHVTERSGGYGGVRENCDLIANIKEKHSAAKAAAGGL